MKKRILTVSALSIFGAVGLVFATTNTPIAEESLGLAKVGVESDSGLKDEAFSYQGKQPGEKNKRIARAYDNAPPMIPHDISDFAIITPENNACIGCHMPDVAKDVGAIAVPKSHLTNLRTDADLKGELYQGRWNCTQCHAPQAVLDPAVNNKFKGAYRKKIGGEYKTNLIDTIKDGVNVQNDGQFNVTKDVVAD